MGPISLNLATLNARGLRDPSKCVHLLVELSNLSVNVASVQETRFTYAADCRALEKDFIIFSAHDRRSSAGVSLQIRRDLDADVNVVFAVDWGRLVVVDVAIKSFKLRVTVVYAPYIAPKGASFSTVGTIPRRSEAASFSGWLESDPKIDKVRRGAKRDGRCESSLIDLMARHDLVDMFRLDHPGRQMRTWLDSSPSTQGWSYLVGWVLWHISLCSLFNVKSIFMRVRPFWDHVGEWTARIKPKQLVLLHVGYFVHNVLPPFQDEKHVVFSRDPSCCQNGDLDDAKEGIVWRCKILIVIWYYSFGISLGSRSDVIENAWIA